MVSKKKICLVLIAMALGVCNIVFAQDGTTQADTQSETSSEQESIKANKETLEKAQEAMAKKDYQSAIVYLSAYISSKPKKYEAYKLRGECFYALHQFKLAEIDFQTAVDLKADDDKFMTGTKYISAVVLGADKQEQLQNTELGNLYGELMYAQKAQNKTEYETSYDKAVEYNSHIYLPQPKKEDITKINCPQKYGKKFNAQGIDAEIYSVIDDIEKGDYHEALYKTPSITSGYPKYYFGYYLSGVALAGMENYNDAIDMFNTALKYNPYDFESMASLGEVYYTRAEKTFSKEDAQKSIDYFKKALHYNPNCNTYYFYTGLNKMILDDYTGAISDFNSAVKIKPNDYNSQYYKLIAQQLNGEYKSVEEGAIKLLYKHVSNYNSVLYLRALAKYRQGLTDEALADIETINNNMNDIYNADIQQKSDKDTVLTSYLYYLKSQILKAKGEGAKTDLQNAMINRVLADILTSKKEITLNSVDFDNQYDYLRETFSDKNLNITYINPDYKITLSDKPVVAQIPAEENIQKPAENTDVTPAEVQNIVEETDIAAAEIEPSEISQKIAVDETTKALKHLETIQPKEEGASKLLKQSTTPAETLAQDNQTSIAQMLASQSLFPSPKTVTAPEIIKNETIKEEITSAPEIAEETNAPKIVSELNTVQNAQQKTAAETQKPVIITAEKLSQTEVPEVKTEKTDLNAPIIVEAPQKVTTPDFTIKYEEPAAIQETTQKVAETIVEKPAETVKEVTNEVTPEKIIVKAEKPLDETQSGNKPFKITYNRPTVSQMPKTSTVETPVLEQTAAASEAAKKITAPSVPVTEKHANVDMTKFEVPKQTPNISADDEIIVFEPQKTIFNQPAVTETAAPDFSFADYAQQTAGELKAAAKQLEQQTENQIITAGEQITEEVTAVPEEQISEPVLVIPELNNVPEMPKIRTVKEVVNEETTAVAQVPAEAVSAQNTKTSDILIDMPEPTTECEIKEAGQTVSEAVQEEKPAKVKKQKVKKEKVKKEKIKKTKNDKLNQETQTAEQTAVQTEDNDIAAVGSIVQSIFKGDNEIKSKSTKQILPEEKEIVEDNNLAKLDNVKPLETEEIQKTTKDAVKQADETVQKEKTSFWSKFQKAKKSEKPAKIKKQTTETANIEDAQKHIKDQTSAKTPWFKRIFKHDKKSKSAEVQTETPAVVETAETFEPAITIIKPEKVKKQKIKKEKVKKEKIKAEKQVKTKTAKVEKTVDSTVQNTAEKKSFFSRFKKDKTKTEKITKTKTTETVPSAVQAEKKVIKQLSKEADKNKE